VTVDRPFPRVRLHVLRVGHCRHPECVAISGGAWRFAEFPALVGLIRHPVAGAILFDTGYAEHFLRATSGFPERLYRWTTPVTLPPEACLQAQLARHGLALHEIAAVFASHLHGDHIAGLRDLPNARRCATCARPVAWVFCAAAISRRCCRTISHDGIAASKRMPVAPCPAAGRRSAPASI
jgi:glyoxylase-like metal-dependent hydrolase (beta-lactamase superfamily II)